MKRPFSFFFFFYDLFIFPPYLFILFWIFFFLVRDQVVDLHWFPCVLIRHSRKTGHVRAILSWSSFDWRILPFLSCWSQLVLTIVTFFVCVFCFHFVKQVAANSWLVGKGAVLNASTPPTERQRRMFIPSQVTEIICGFLFPPSLEHISRWW